MYNFYKKDLEYLKNNKLNRTHHAFAHKTQGKIVDDDNVYINFTSNDYLGLANHPAVKKALHKSIDEYSYYSTASPAVSGYSIIHKKVEEAFAHFLHQEKAIFYSSGYLANLGAITALAKNKPKLIADKLCHASLIDGIHLTKLSFKRFPHFNLDIANKLLNKADEAIIIIESVFSMDGDIFPIPRLINICDDNAHIIFVDDTHGIGVLGNRGQGFQAHFNIPSSKNILISFSLSKALGCTGGIIAGNAVIIDYILQFSRTYRYSTAPSPLFAHAALSCLETLQNETWRVYHLKYLIHYFNKYAKYKSIRLCSYDETPIRVVLTKSIEDCLTIQSVCKKYGFYVAAIRSPSVPINKPRIRISLNVHHTCNEIRELLNIIASAL